MTDTSLSSILKQAAEEYWKTLKRSNINAGLYNRFSDEGVSEDSKTLESQEKECRRYCANVGYNVVEEHVYKEAKSSTIRTYRQRPKFMQLLDACQRKEIDVVIVTEYGRISRTQDEQALLIALIQSFGVRVESVTEKFDDTAVGKFMRSANAFASELEVEKIRYRTARGKMDRLRNGNLPGGGFPNYGYIYIDTKDETSAHYQINDEVFYIEPDGTKWSQAKIVRWIYDRADEGWSVNRIAKELTSKHIPTMRGKEVWNTHQVHNILTSRFYIGEARALRWTRDEKHKPVPRPEEEQIILPAGVVPPIIVDAEGNADVYRFERIQEKLKEHKVDAVRSNKHDELGLLRAGHCKCGICGYSMKVHYHNERTRTGRNGPQLHPPEYYCRTKNGGDGERNNHGINISMRALDKQAWEYAKHYIRDPQLVRNHIDEIRKRAEHESHKEAILAQIEEYNRKIRNLRRIAEDAGDDEELEEIRGRLREVEKQRAKMQRYLYNEEQEEELNAKVNAELDRFERWADRVRPELDDPEREWCYEEKREAIKILGVTAIIHPGSDPGRVKFRCSPPRIVDLLSLTS